MKQIDLEHAFELADEDNSGGIDKDEFILLYAKVKKVSEKDGEAARPADTALVSHHNYLGCARAGRGRGCGHELQA